MIIDCHSHVFFEEVRARRAVFQRRDPWFGTLYERPTAKLATAEDVVAAMAVSGVDRTVIMGFPWRDGGLCAAHNEYLIDAVRRAPDHLIGFAAVQPLDGAGAARELERCLQAGLLGCGELGPDGQGFDLADPAHLGPIAEVLIAAGRPLLVHSSEPVGHLYGGKGTVYPPKLLAAAQAFPALTIICAHWGGGLPFYELMPEVAAALRNVYYDTAASTYLYDFRIFALGVRLVGAGRILWGTDYPLLGQTRFLERVRAVGLDPADEAAILGGNAARLLRLASRQ
jgi:predicted TIM-barrel fold metal-dependent hydrolase